MRQATVRTPTTLLEGLSGLFAGVTRTKAKQLIKYGAVQVNGQAASRHDVALRPGDRIEILPKTLSRSYLSRIAPPFPIVHEDGHVIVIDKPAGLLSMATDDEREHTAYREVTGYVRARGGAAERIFIVHRLDRDASGLLVFARDEVSKRRLQEGWERAEKRYYAVVEGRPHPAAGTIKSFLRTTSSLDVRSSVHARAGRKSVTGYRTVSSTGRRSLVDVELLTGRKHQIRVHLSELGCPIVGDRRYGEKSKERLALHAWKLAFDHPATGERLVFTSPLPRELAKLAGPPAAGQSPR